MRFKPRLLDARSPQLVQALHFSIWKQLFAFAVGFSIEFNALIGGSGEGAAALGGYGYRLTDIMSVIALGLLSIYALALRRLLALALFTLVVGSIGLLRILEPTFWADPRTEILFGHYIMYSFSGLYLAIILSNPIMISRFCWGLILGLLATIPIYVLEEAGYATTLIDLGLLPGYYRVLQAFVGGASRFAGLLGHPNEAGHVSAIAAAAGAYLFYVHRRFLPLALVAIGLFAVFYYTQTRGGLIVGGTILAISFLWGRRGTEVLWMIVSASIVAIIIMIAFQFETVASRFVANQATENNFTERFDSTLVGLQVVLTNPFGMAPTDFAAYIDVGTAGTTSPHNGFIYFAAIFGLIPCAILGAAFVFNLRIRDDTDVFFCFLTMQIILSFMFEELPGSYSFALPTCILLVRPYLRTWIGNELKVRPLVTASRVDPARHFRKQVSFPRSHAD